jgi:hypothetical protein
VVRAPAGCHHRPITTPADISELLDELREGSAAKRPAEVVA